MPPAYKWKPLPAGAFGRSVNPETIRRNQHRASLTPLETAFERARANRGNRLKQRRDFARGYDDYKALEDADKAAVDQAMVTEENELLEQVRRAILADWRRYYPNQFDEDGVPLADPPIPIEVNSPLNSPAPAVNPSPKLRPGARMKSLIDRVAKRQRSLTSASATSSPSEASSNIGLQGQSSWFATRGASSSPVSAGVRSTPRLLSAATRTDNSLGKPIPQHAGFGIYRSGGFRASNTESSQTSLLAHTGGQDRSSDSSLTKKDMERDLDIIFREKELEVKGGPMFDCANPIDWVLSDDEVEEEWEEGEDEDTDIIDLSESGVENGGDSDHDGEEDWEEEEEREEDHYSQTLINSNGGDINMTGVEESNPPGSARGGGPLNRPGLEPSSGLPNKDGSQKRSRASSPEARMPRDFYQGSREQLERVKSIGIRKKRNAADSARLIVILEAAARKDAEHLGIDLEEMDRIDREMDRQALLNASR